MDRTICAPETSRGRECSASRGPVDASPFPEGAITACGAAAAAARGGRPVAARWPAGFCGCPWSLRLMDRTICAPETSRGRECSASRGPVDASPFPEGAITACGAAAAAARGGRPVAARWPAGFCGCPWSQMCFRVTKTSGRGAPPDPRTTFRAPQAGRPTCPSSGNASGAGRAWLPPATTASRPCAAVPNSPAANQSANGFLLRLEAALDTLPGRIACLGATRGGGAGGAQTRPAPNPQQAFGLPGRSGHGLSAPCATGERGGEAERRCRASG